jgi:hypothetical protein
MVAFRQPRKLQDRGTLTGAFHVPSPALVSPNRGEELLRPVLLRDSESFHRIEHIETRVCLHHMERQLACPQYHSCPTSGRATSQHGFPDIELPKTG